MSGGHLILVICDVAWLAHLDQVWAEPRPQPACRRARTGSAGRRARCRCRM